MRCTKLFQARAAGALALLACTLGCGGKVNDTDTAPEPSLAAPRGPRFAPPLGSTGRPTPAPPMMGRAPAPPSEVPSAPVVPPQGTGVATAKDAAENVLAADCGLCHGPGADAAGSGGILFINDLDALVEAGLIVPLNSAGSRIVQVMLDGSMPPASAGYQATNADIATLASYIDNPRFWPDLAPPTVADAGVGSPPTPPVLDAGAPPTVEPRADGGAAPLPTDE
jgi:mono/diheme cytochrome c family protein